MKPEKHQFGFIFVQSATQQISQQTIEKSCRNFIAEVTPHLAQPANSQRKKSFPIFISIKEQMRLKA